MMKKAPALSLAAVIGVLAVTARIQAAGEVPPAPNGIAFPADYRDWRVISVSHRADNNTLRAIVGNDAAVRAARDGRTNPWPDGAVLGKVVWKQTAGEHWPTAIVPKEFVHAEFMFKDARKWAATGGWGYARWVGTDLKPYGKDDKFAQECVACHTPVKSRDYVFTTPALMPGRP
ncbi:MAG TPA: cytochrome P460 family protein [Acidiferrobacterales bacterium]